MTVSERGAGSRPGFAALAGRLPFPHVRRRRDERVVAGVCGGTAAALGVDPTLVRLVFALLALASGSGIVLYFAAWLLLPEEEADIRPRRRRREVGGVVLLLVAGVLALRGLGLVDSRLWPAAVVAVGVALVFRRGSPERLRRAAARRPLGILAVAGGAVLFLEANGFSGPQPALLAPGAIAVGLLLVVGPWLWRLARERDAERTARIRTQERAEMAARVHDSVLQTLALIQREAADPRRVASLARRQERELRGWLYADASRLGGETLAAAIEAAASEIEELHGVRVEIATAGDSPLDERLRALVLAAREAMANAAKFSGVPEVSVYVEASEAEASVFVRDRGAGFDRAAIAPDRRGIAESIEGRMARHGGTATVTSAAGEGTEVELVMPRSAP